MKLCYRVFYEFFSRVDSCLCGVLCCPPKFLGLMLGMLLDGGLLLARDAGATGDRPDLERWLLKMVLKIGQMSLIGWAAAVASHRS
ncbi:hypothetical protein ACLOJK_038592 [Asimina triloba]